MSKGKLSDRIIYEEEEIQSQPITSKKQYTDDDARIEYSETKISSDFSLPNNDFIYLDSDNIDKDLICSICQYPFIDPIMHSGCGQMFCTKCIIDKVDKCPLCRGNDLKQNSLAVPKYILNKLDELKVQCSMCKGGVQRGHLKDHQEKYCSLLDAYKQVEELKRKLEEELKKKNEQILNDEREKLQKMEKDLMQQFLEKKKSLEKREQEFVNQQLVRCKLEDSNKPIYLNVGGTIMTVSLGTFTHNEREPDNLFKKMFNGEYPLYQTSNQFNENVYFIDCDSFIFKHILDWLKYGIIDRELNVDLRKLLVVSKSFGIDLRSAILQHVNLAGREIIGFDFSGMNLKDANFKASNFKDCHFSNLCIARENFKKAQFENVVFENCIIQMHLRKNSLKNCKFIACNFDGSTFEKVDYKLIEHIMSTNSSINCVIKNTDLDEMRDLSKFKGFKFDSCSFDFSKFINKIIDSIHFENINLDSQDLSLLFFSNCTFIGPFKNVKLDSNFGILHSNIINHFGSLVSITLYNHTKSKAIPQLLYRGTRDGFTARDFHLKCDKQGPTLTIIKSEHNHIFGAFTYQSWDSLQNFNYLMDDSAFIFKILDLNGTLLVQKFNIIQEKKQNAIEAHYNYLTIFGGNSYSEGDICISTDCNLKGDSYSNFGCTYELPYGYRYGTDEAKSYLAGTYSFKVVEIEVFKIIN